MADIVFNVAKGRIAYYADLAASNDALLVVPIETSGIVADSVMRDYTTLDAILAGASNEQTSMGRKLVTSGVTNPVDQANDRVDIDMADLTWTSATGNAISALVICYVPDTTVSGGTFLVPNSTRDATAIPLSKHDFVVTPNGGDIVAQIAATGFLRAS